MKISDWLDQQEGAKVDVSQIELPQDLAFEQDPDETTYYQEFKPCSLVCKKDHPFATVERFGHWYRARLSPANPAVAERFELYVKGLELANGFSELTDPAEQRRRFEGDRALIRAAGRRPPPLPRRFLADLAEMPPAAGIALGIDRLAMILLGAERIDQVQTFTPEQL